MFHSMSRLLFILYLFLTGEAKNSISCRNQPGDLGFPSLQTLSQFNESIGGRLLNVVPTGSFAKR